MLNDQMGSGKRVIGIIGGSGFYQLVQGGDTLTHQVDTPWGAPSADIIQGKIGEVEVLFLARHGIGHQLPPGEINYRANIDALKQLGATDIISVSSCGSLREDLPPTTFVLVDQYIDRTTTARNHFLTRGLSPMSPWRTRSARRCNARSWRHVRHLIFRTMMAACIFVWTGLNFRRARNRICIGNGVAM